MRLCHTHEVCSVSEMEWQNENTDLGKSGSATEVRHF
jgi:hypothetical protein